MAIADWYPDPERQGWLRYWDGAQWTEHRSEVPAAVGPLLSLTSHEKGRNATVRLWPDRIEREQLSYMGGFAGTEVTPIRAVSSVSTARDGWYTAVTVHASGAAITFRLSHGEAEQFRQAVFSLIL